MNIERAIDIAEERGFTLKWNKYFEFYEISGNGICDDIFLEYWLDMFTEEEFIQELEDLLIENGCIP